MRVLLKALPFLLALLVIIPVTANAHTGLESSSPSNGETVKQELTEIELTFKTKIESLSTFTVVPEQGDEIKAKIALESATMKGTLDQPLPTGNYKIAWKIVGTDGHPIEGEIPFQVELPQIEDPIPAHEVAPEEIEPSSPEGSNDSPAQTNESLTETEDSIEENSPTNESTNSNSAPTIVYIIAGVLLVIVIVFIAKRRSSK